MKVMRGVEFPIYPDVEQEVLIQKTFGCVRFIWNHMLSDEQEFYVATGEHYIPTPARYKTEFPFLKEVDSLALANTQLDLNRAFSDFFKNAGHFKHPGFKSKKKSKKSYTTNCQYNKSGATIYLTKDGIRLPKLGIVKAFLYRVIPTNWILKRATIKQTKTGKYFCVLQFEIEIPDPEEVLPTEENTVGLDYSSPHFYVDNNGYSPESIHWFRESERKLAHEQRLLSHLVYGSKNYEKQQQKIRHLYEHIANQRKDFIHKESRRIANVYGAVCVEDINLRAMSQTLRLGKSTMDNGFGMFRDALKYKLEEQGKHLIKIDEWFPSSKTCSYCGEANHDLQLEDREWVCPHCRRLIQRDRNAGTNIKREGIRQFYAERKSATKTIA